MFENGGPPSSDSITSRTPSSVVDHVVGCTSLRVNERGREDPVGERGAAEIHRVGPDPIERDVDRLDEQRSGITPPPPDRSSGRAKRNSQLSRPHTGCRGSPGCSGSASTWTSGDSVHSDGVLATDSTDPSSPRARSRRAIRKRTRTTNDPVLTQGTPSPHPGSPSSSIDVASLGLTSSCVARASTIALHLCAERSNAAQPTAYGSGDSVTEAGRLGRLCRLRTGGRRLGRLDCPWRGPTVQSRTSGDDRQHREEDCQGMSTHDLGW